MKVTLTRVTQNPVLAIEEAASNCYDSEPTTDGRIMKACYKSGHHSVLEFADFTFHIELISRACSHQVVRHRHASYAQRSQRYVSEDNFEYVTPPTIQMNVEALTKYVEYMDNCRKVYNELIDLGVPAEDARYVLPNACATIIEVKVNGRELIHIANERMCTRAQWEIRDLIQKMKKCVQEYDEQCAEFAKFLVPKCCANHKYPFCTEHKSCGLAPKLKDVYEGYLSSKEDVTDE